jgi:hypothetical protein
MSTTNRRIVGIVLLAVGGLLLFFGFNASHSVTEQVVEGVTGRFTDKTTWYFVLGFAGAIAGIALLALPRGKG